ncbi:MAG: sigma-70 family RNA polymerase sigma factor [Sandaracinaceae bacterium]|nr:sigma-70 family RNA polymerase sigma factor [Sandaracinaceae bacterium]
MIDAGARARWAELRATLEPFVARRVPAEDVDDVVQDVFLRLSRGLPSLRDEERFGPWVYRVARSAVADHLRARARAPFSSLEDEEPAATPDEPALTEGERLLAPLVGVFVAALPSPYREALTLTELEGMSQRDAADRVGITVSGMKSRVQRGRERLRASFEACCAIERDARGRVVEISPRPGGRVPDGCSC